MKKKLLLYISILIIAFSSFNVRSSFNPFLGTDHFTEAILQTYFAINASDLNAIVKHAQQATKHAVATRYDVSQEVDHQLIDRGIQSLIIVVEEGTSGNIEAARKAAHNALVFITQSAR
ncbi:MAG: hypothetical protein H0X02_02875 [Nitrosomonas sp.]|nr:hypothetical protein [Nitrosomonas sp.]